MNRQFNENAKIYGIGLLVLMAFLAFMFLLVHQWQDSFSGAVQNGVFVIGLFLSGGLVSNAMFQEFSNLSSCIWLLSLPVKHIEKLMTSIILSVFLFLGVYFVVFYVVDMVYLSVTGKLQWNLLLNPFKEGFYQFFFWYFIYNGIILLGSVVFNKHSLIKTLLAGILCLIVFNYINTLLLEFLIPEVTIVSSLAFDNFQFTNLGENIKVFLPEQADLMSSIFVRAILPISIWSIVWLKLKEKEV
ncbi:hypothetical protein [Spongiimicrobium salis]|uniref:hypothetical protein n=1 Tax=Spongiimicrobium salis TaxID=1667022 RepID=UPI00374DB30F